MTENRNPLGEPDRTQLGAAERFEVQQLAERHGISTQEARELIERLGNDRELLDREAAKLRNP